MAPYEIKSVNLCLATRLFYPYYSGGALRFMRYMPGLKERNIQTHVFTGTPTLKRAKAFGAKIAWQNVPVGEYLPIERINEALVHRVRLPDIGTRRSFFQYGRALYKFSHQMGVHLDIIQFMSLPLWTSPWLLPLRRIRVPKVINYNLLNKFSSNPIKENLQKCFWKWPFQIVDCVIVNSAVMRETLQRMGVTSRIEVIPNGVDLSRFHPRNVADRNSVLRQELGVKPNDILIVNVGSVEPRKGIDVLLKAWSYLAPEHLNCHLAILGPRPDLIDPNLASFHHQLEQLVVASGAAERVHFVGYVENVEDYLRIADIFAFTSRREGLPNAVFEAMATGLSVVMTPFVGISNELGQAGEEYLLVEPDPEVISATLARLIVDENARIQLGRGARAWVETHMNLEASLNSYANLYRELCVN